MTYAAASEDDSGISILRLVNVVLRHIWLIVGISGLFATYALVTGLTGSRTWSSDATFIPQGARAPTSVSSIAAQFGLSGGGAEAGQSPQFYVDLIATREVQRGVVNATYTVHTDTGVIVGNLVKVYGIKKKPTNSPETSAMKMLAASVSAAPSLKTGVITLRATTPYPELSAQLIASFFAQINRFNLIGRQSRASAERNFTEQRLSEAQAALTAAEDNMEQFLLTNRDLGSPSLQLRRERLNRAVATRQEVYTALAQSYEQSKIEELRDTPAITVIDPPVVPIEPNPRGTISKTIKSLVFGALLGTMLAFLLDYFKRSGGSNSEAYREFTEAAHNTFRLPRRARKA
jgi:uncharacterized protein involved in exopolysaccharide biosynthesis